jgi:hypothetical protein
MVPNLKKSMFQSEFGKEIWNTYFFYLDRPEPKQRDGVIPYTEILSNPALLEQMSTKPTPERHTEETLESRVAEPVRRVEAQRTEVPRVEEHEPLAPKQKPRRVNFDALFEGKEEVAEPQVVVPEVAVVKQLPQMQQDNLTLYDIRRYFKNSGVVGEESLSIAITLAVINGISFGVEGFSGSGKTFVVDKLIDLLPDEWVYRCELSSKMAVFYDAEKINGHKIIYIPELQKAMNDKKSPILEVIKNLTEGKEAKRTVTNSDRNGTRDYTIDKKEIIYTLALENYLKKDEETARRMMILQTDSSKEHLDEIHEYKARKRFIIDPDVKNTESLKLRIREHIAAIAETENIRVFDPCSNYFKELIPKTQKSVGYIDHYYNLVDACVKFHLNSRETFEHDGARYIVANVEDHYNVFQMYFREFMKVLKSFADRMPQGQEKEDALEELIEVKEPSWADCLESSRKLLFEDQSMNGIREAFPNLPDKWYARQIKDGKIYVTDLKTGKDTSIAEISPAQKLEEKVEYSI